MYFLINGFFFWLSKFLNRKRNRILILSTGLLVFALSVFLSLRLEIRTNYIELFDLNDHIALDYTYALRNFGGLDYLFLGLETDNVDSTKKIIDILVKRFQNLLGVVYKVQDTKLDRQFLVMEYVEGKTLCEYVRASGPRLRVNTCHDLDNIQD